MKQLITLVALTLFVLPAFSQKKKKDKDKDEGAVIPVVVTPAVMSAQDSLSYAFGVNMANNIKNQGVDNLSYDAFMEGLRAGFGESAKMTNEEATTYLKAFFAAKKLRDDEANRQKGQQFLEANKSKEGVVVLPSGLQYKILKKGTSPQKPLITDKVKTHYHGTLIDGTVFDSSVDRGQPASFPVSQVIRGWVEALQLMNVGDKWELYIPAELAYGPRSQGPKIKPYSTLIFQVELLEIEK